MVNITVIKVSKIFVDKQFSNYEIQQPFATGQH